MKKLSSMLALGMALALTFGMTVSAAGSTTTQNPNFQPTEEEKQIAQEVIAAGKADVQAVDSNVEVTTKDVAVETVAEVVQGDVVQAALDAISDADWAKAVEQLVANTGNSIALDNVDKVTVGSIPVAAVDIECDEIPAGGLTLEIANANIQPDGTTTYVVMHLNSVTGEWEIIVPDKVENGKVIVTFTSLSPALVNPAVIVPVGEDVEESKEESVQPDWPEPRHPEATTASPATSPKTAETLPLAGVMALIGLAGAAICASKVRYNK